MMVVMRVGVILLVRDLVIEVVHVIMIFHTALLDQFLMPRTE